jgi:hypothetical protein
MPREEDTSSSSTEETVLAGTACGPATANAPLPTPLSREELKRKRHREYMRQWIKRPENVPKIRARQKRWEGENPERTRERYRRGSENWRRNHPERAVEVKRRHRPKETERMRRWRNEHRELYYATSRWKRDNLKFRAMAVLCGGYPYCLRCGESDLEVLTIDHIGGRKTKGKRTNLELAGKLYARIVRGEVLGPYQVLCMSHNFKFKQRPSPDFRNN